jgi:hypothetical protein
MITSTWGFYSLRFCSMTLLLPLYAADAKSLIHWRRSVSGFNYLVVRCCKMRWDDDIYKYKCGLFLQPVIHDWHEVCDCIPGNRMTHLLRPDILSDAFKLPLNYSAVSRVCTLLPASANASGYEKYAAWITRFWKYVYAGTLAKEGGVCKLLTLHCMFHLGLTVLAPPDLYWVRLGMVHN